WLALWLLVYRKPEEHPSCSPAELQYIRSDPTPSPAKIPWLTLLPHSQTLAYAVGKFMIDPIWWFYLFWIPDFLTRKYGIDLMHVGLPIFVIYVIGDTGSVGGGWLSSRLIHRGHSVNMARKTAMLACALCALPMVVVPTLHSAWGAILLLGLGTA